jgi:hypothetical protein
MEINPQSILPTVKTPGKIPLKFLIEFYVVAQFIGRSSLSPCGRELERGVTLPYPLLYEP